MEPQDKYREVESALEKFWGEEDLLVGKGKSTPAQIALRFRNAMVLLAAILFLLSFASNRYPILRAVGYLFGAIAYICEIMVLTDCFKVKIPQTQRSMPYRWAPLPHYMGVRYLGGHDLPTKKPPQMAVFSFLRYPLSRVWGAPLSPPPSRSSRRGRELADDVLVAALDILHLDDASCLRAARR